MADSLRKSTERTAVGLSGAGDWVAPPTAAVKSLAADADAFLLRLEGLVLTLLENRFEGAQDVWQLQLDLLVLQQQLQARIGEAKRQLHEGADPAGLAALKDARWHARRFGDAIAWVVLGMDRLVIYPLAKNQRVSVPPESHGTRGTLAVAETLANNGMGFPLLHDITDCMRIGDITFIKRDEAARTVEVKTRQPARKGCDGDTVGWEYCATVMWHSHTPPTTAGEHSLPVDANCNGLPSDSRTLRQLSRMTKAHIEQTVEPERYREFDGVNFTSAHVKAPSSGTHWQALCRVAESARTAGYASEALHATFLYVAIYDPAGWTRANLAEKAAPLPRDIIGSGMLPEVRTASDSVLVTSIPDPLNVGPQLFLPYFLYSLPTDTILDLLHGRLVLMNIVNPGRIAGAVEKAGYSVSIPQPGHSWSLFQVESDTLADNGRQYRVKFNPMGLHFYEMLMEFRSVEYFMTILDAMKDSAGAISQMTPSVTKSYRVHPRQNA
jgi:hypothetical protein